MSILTWIEDKKRLKLLNAPKHVNSSSDSTKGLWTRCDKCGVILYIKHLKENQRVCFGCSYHLQMMSQERIENLLDKVSVRPFEYTESEESFALYGPSYKSEIGDDVAGKSFAKQPQSKVLTNTNQRFARRFEYTKGNAGYKAKSKAKLSSPLSTRSQQGNTDQVASKMQKENRISTWRPLDETVSPCDPLKFVDQKNYTDRLQDAQERTGLQDAIQTGTGMIDGIPVALAVMDFSFMGGSMGSVVGEKLTRLIEYATQEGLTLIVVSASGGARMQEGVFSLMQMAKISSALQIYQSCANLLYISILTSPTTGGVTASFAMLGDIIFAEPKALIAFAGRRVIEQTLCEDLPDDFQTSEYMLHHGLVDLIVPRRFLRQALSESIKLYQNAPFKKIGRIPFGVQNPITFLTEEKIRRQWNGLTKKGTKRINNEQYQSKELHGFASNERTANLIKPLQRPDLTNQGFVAAYKHKYKDSQIKPGEYYQESKITTAQYREILTSFRIMLHLFSSRVDDTTSVKAKVSSLSASKSKISDASTLHFSAQPRRVCTFFSDSDSSETVKEAKKENASSFKVKEQTVGQQNFLESENLYFYPPFFIYKYKSSYKSSICTCTSKKHKTKSSLLKGEKVGITSPKLHLASKTSPNPLKGIRQKNVLQSKTKAKKKKIVAYKYKSLISSPTGVGLASVHSKTLFTSSDPLKGERQNTYKSSIGNAPYGTKSLKILNLYAKYKAMQSTKRSFIPLLTNTNQRFVRRFVPNQSIAAQRSINKYLSFLEPSFTGLGKIPGTRIKSNHNRNGSFYLGSNENRRKQSFVMLRVHQKSKAVGAFNLRFVKSTRKNTFAPFGAFPLSAYKYSFAPLVHPKQNTKQSFESTFGANQKDSKSQINASTTKSAAKNLENDLNLLNQAIELAATESVEWRAFYIDQQLSENMGFLDDFLQDHKNYPIKNSNLLFYKSICRVASGLQIDNL